MTTLPETTAKLLTAIQAISGISDTYNTRRVVICADGRNGGIEFFPVKNKLTSAAIEQAGISGLVLRYSFQRTRAAVADHFREGVYDVSGPKIIVLK